MPSTAPSESEVGLSVHFVSPTCRCVIILGNKSSRPDRVQVLSSFDARVDGVDNESTKTWKEKKVTGLLESAWKENFRRYTRHPEEFDVIAAAAVRYQHEQGELPKSKAKASSASKYITRFAPPSSEPEEAADADDDDKKSSSSSD